MKICCPFFTIQSRSHVTFDWQVSQSPLKWNSSVLSPFFFVFYHIFEEYRSVILCNDTQFGFLSGFLVIWSGSRSQRWSVLRVAQDVCLTHTGDGKLGQVVKAVSLRFLHWKVTIFSLCNFMINKYIGRKDFGMKSFSSSNLGLY